MYRFKKQEALFWNFRIIKTNNHSDRSRGYLHFAFFVRVVGATCRIVRVTRGNIVNLFGSLDPTWRPIKFNMLRFPPLPRMPIHIFSPYKASPIQCLLILQELVISTTTTIIIIIITLLLLPLFLLLLLLLPSGLFLCNSLIFTT